MGLKPLTPDDIIKELCLDRYISQQDELQEITAKSRDVFAAQIENTHDSPAQIAGALAFMRTIWHKYDCDEVADIYDKFTKMEEALFGLEREEGTGRRYRDHFIHMFNCFVFGLRVISPLLDQVSPQTAKNMFKIEDESLTQVGLPFGRDYKYDQRLFYLWTLVSTFHDIAIPFQHLGALGQGISRFVDEFGWVFTDPQVTMHNFDSSQLYYYFNLLGSLYGGQLKLIDDGRKYAKAENGHPYLTKLLGREFDRKDHGVMSGFFMWKTIEEIFLVDRSTKYRLKIDQFNKYTEYVLEQDIARAALAISLHAVKEDERSHALPKVLPLPFAAYPVAFLLILSDELQEYLRWEGISVQKEQGKFNYHPLLNIKYDEADNAVSLSVDFSLNSKDEEIIVKQATQLAQFSGHGSGITDVAEAVDLIGNSIKKSLERKLQLGDKFKLKLNIRRDWDKIWFAKDLASVS